MMREHWYVAIGWIGVSLFCIGAWAVTITACTTALRLMAE